MTQFNVTARASGKTSSTMEQIDSVRQIVLPTVLVVSLCSESFRIDCAQSQRPIQLEARE
jgi:hypothetical protein